MNVAVFFERDGVLNRASLDRQNRRGPVAFADFEIVEGAAATLERLREAGFKLIVTTNQPGISEGWLSRRELDRMHEWLRAMLPVDDILVCPHDAGDDCPCRKPRPGLFFEARCRWKLDMDRSFVVSDKWQDARAASASGCTSVLIESRWVGSVHHDLLVPDLSTAVERILQFQTIPAAVMA